MTEPTDEELRAATAERLGEDMVAVDVFLPWGDGNPKRDRPRVIVEGDKPNVLDFAELPNGALKELLRSGGSDAAWDEAVDRVWAKAERGDYGKPDDDEAEGGEPSP